jgi:hypothetical protein
MTKAEQVRLTAWRLRVLRHAADQGLSCELVPIRMHVVVTAMLDDYPALAHVAIPASRPNEC